MKWTDSIGAKLLKSDNVLSKIFIISTYNFKEAKKATVEAFDTKRNAQVSTE
jgi:hypothetical protein